METVSRHRKLKDRESTETQRPRHRTGYTETESETEQIQSKETLETGSTETVRETG